MKLLFPAIFFCLFTTLTVHAQDYPDFGMPSKDEIDLKECPFEKEATAVVLIHEAFSYSENNHDLITTHHVRIKILKQSGVGAADITIPFEKADNFEFIDQLQAVTINIDDKGLPILQKVDKKLIYTTKIDNVTSQINFAFPSVKAGSIIEYQYRSTMDNYWGLRDWYFQDDIPVLISRYHLTVLSDKQFIYKITKRPGQEATILPEKNKIFFEMKNIPGFSAETYMDCRNDYVQKVSFQVNAYSPGWDFSTVNTFYSTWTELNNRLKTRESFGKQLEANISGTKDFINDTKKLSSPEAKMATVYNCIRSNMVWDSYVAIVSGDGVNNAFKKHSGSSSDINLCLVNLLTKVNLESYPVLVSSRTHGIVDTSYPFVDQFNGVIACAIINNKKYFLDATNKYTPAGLAPLKFLNTAAFLINKKNGELITITGEPSLYKKGIYLDCKVSEQGILKGSALIKNKDYARLENIKDYKEDSLHFKTALEQKKGATLKITRFSIENPDNDSLPFNEAFEFETVLNGTGEYKFIPVNFFMGFDNNPFIAEDRYSNINFGYQRAINLNAAIEVPANYTVDGFPKSITLQTPEKDITFMRSINYNQENNTIYCTLKLECNKSFYEAAYYPVIKEMYKKIFNLLEEQVVLKKKQ